MLLPQITSAEHFSWFPDSTELLASWETTNHRFGLWAFSILGGTPRQLTEEGFAASVSPDGSKIVFLKSAHFGENGGEIWVMDGNGANQRKVIGVSPQQEVFHSPSWSPDGRRIVLSELLGIPTEDFERKIRGMASLNLVQQGAELSYLLLHDPQFRSKMRKEHLFEVGKRIRLKSNIKQVYEILDHQIEGFRFEFYVLSAAPVEVIQSALEDITSWRISVALLVINLLGGWRSAV